MSMQEDRYEIRFGGSGGQGIITAALVLAHAVSVYGGKHVCQTQSYGPEARGGKSKAEVVISSRPIDYPKVMRMDMLLAMNQEACDAYSFDFKPNGLLLVDSTFVEQLPTSRAVSIPFTRIAKDEIGNVLTANMIALGALGQLSKQVSMKSLEAAVTERMPKGTTELNLKALRVGIKAAKKIDLAALPRSISHDEEEEV